MFFMTKKAKKNCALQKDERKELTDEVKSVSSLFMNPEKCCQIVAAKGLNPSKTQ